jgi:hypothetical protein
MAGSGGLGGGVTLVMALLRCVERSFTRVKRRPAAVGRSDERVMPSPRERSRQVTRVIRVPTHRDRRVTAVIDRTASRERRVAPIASMLRVYDLSGRLVSGLVERRLQEASQVVSWDAATLRDLPAGVYFLKLTAAGQDATRKFVVLPGRGH